MWNADENKCVSEIEPIFGRSILFYQSSKSCMDIPNPVNASDGRTRRSAAAYFYSNGDPTRKALAFTPRCFPNLVTLTGGEKFSNAMKYLTPPILLDAIRKVKSYLR